MIQYTEYIGYIASSVVLISFLMGNIVYLRIVNSIGCAFFIFYGILLDSKPIIVTNAAIVLINLYYLNKSRNSN